MPGVPSADIALIRWPGEADRLPALRGERIPRLLLVDPDAAPPVAADELEDWVRVPAPERDLKARLEGLSRRARFAGRRRPEMDGDGVVRFGTRHALVPPVEGRIARLLVDHFGAVVSRTDLTEAGWPGGNPGRNALDVHVLRLRRRLAEAGLSIRTVRSRGYLLEAAEEATDESLASGS